MTRTNWRLVACAIAGILLFSGCSGTGADETTSTSLASSTTSVSTSSLDPTTTVSTSSGVPTTSATTSTSAAPTTTKPQPPPTTTVVSGPESVTISVSVTDGEVSGPGRVTVTFGAQIQLTVTSDEPDEVHFHGYDVFADVGPGTPARMILIADIPGVFEVELEGRGLELLIVEVK